MINLSEHEFGDLLLNSAEIQKLIKTKNFLVAREFRVGVGVPDFVLVSEEGFNQILSLSSQYPFETFRGLNSSIISIIYSKPGAKTTSQLAKDCFTGYDQIVKSIIKLNDQGVLSYDQVKQTVSRAKGFRLPIIEVVSLELKLHKWRKALWQASRNRAYYQKSYVVMPAEKEDLMKKNIDHFYCNGVSAAVLDTKGGSVKLVKSIDSSKNYWFDTDKLNGISYLMEGHSSFSSTA